MLIQEELQQEEDIGTEPAGAAKMTKDNLLQQDDDAKVRSKRMIQENLQQDDDAQELQQEDYIRDLAAR
ncbi:unnamed protein product [Sphagnum jensenii]|jgi:hypothetical protein|uniref:Uncharacterized protein n=1 Tax=Sphagnum jensenii TaxID=128206 RepID=A0ABP0WT54_9BRYO